METPSSTSCGSVFSFRGVADLAGSDNGLVSDKTLLPSIEGDSSAPSNRNHAMSGALHSRNPSFTYTPPPSDSSGSKATPSSPGAAAHRGTIDNIRQALGTIRLSTPDSSLDMSHVAAALDGVAGGALSPSRTPPSSKGVQAPSSASRRRSSSRVKITTLHDVRDEEPPRDRFHEPGFQQAFADAKRAVADLTGVLESSSLSLHAEPDSTMRRLHGEAEVLSRFLCPSTRIVGFVGDSGVGKCLCSSFWCVSVG